MNAMSDVPFPALVQFTALLTEAELAAAVLEYIERRVYVTNKEISVGAFEYDKDKGVTVRAFVGKKRAEAA